MFEKLAAEAFVVEFIKSIREKDPGIGGEKLWLMYSERFGASRHVGYNHFYDIMETYNLKVRKRKRRTKTTDSNHQLPVYPNQIKEIIADRPNQIWVSDITYLPFWLNAADQKYDFCYLSLITDIYTKEIVGYCVGETLETKYTLKALTMALERFKDHPLLDLIHHSDRGVQYASYLYTDTLRESNIKISMTESGNPKDNAVAERVNNTIKNELFFGLEFYSIKEVEKAIHEAICFYNKERPHMSLNNMTPAEAANCTGELKKKWISYREKALKKNIAKNV